MGGGVERLQLVRRKFNSGSGSVPRNTGIKLSRGEYIMFVDSDDAIISTAMEEFYSTATKFNAEVIHCEKFYEASQKNFTTNKNELSIAYNMNDFVNEPVFLTDNIAERIKNFSLKKLDWTTWLNFIKRDFIIKNNIEFPNVRVCVDSIFFVYLICLAPNILRVPIVNYIYRKQPSSVSNFSKLSAEERIRRWGNFFFAGINILDDFFNTIPLFKEHTEYKYAVYNVLMSNNEFPINQIYAQIPAYQLDGLIRRELEKIDDTSALSAFLFSRMNVFKVNLIQQQNLIRQQQMQIQHLQAQIQQLKQN